jgi:hypothetical protein
MYCWSNFLPGRSVLRTNQLFEHESIHFGCMPTNDSPFLGRIKIRACLLLHSIFVGFHHGTSSIRFIRVCCLASLSRDRTWRSNSLWSYKHDCKHAGSSGNFRSYPNPCKRSFNRCLYSTWYFMLHLNCGHYFNFLDQASTTNRKEIIRIIKALDHEPQPI